MNSNDEKIWLLRLNDSEQKETGHQKSDTKSDDRQADGHSDAHSHSHDDDAPQMHKGHEVLPEDTLGVALSGGGIRSATFCLGILQSMAKNKWLGNVDYLSSVSGGGYIGSFLGRYFDINKEPGKKTPVEIENEIADHQSQPIQWLRTHANYLSPRGLGDTAFNIASFWRNFFTVHLILFLFVYSILGLVQTISYYPWDSTTGWVGGISVLTIELVESITPLTANLFGSLSLISIWHYATELMIWFAVVPLGIAYWVVSRERYEEFIVRALSAVFILTVLALLATAWVGAILVFASIIFWVLLTWWTIKSNEGHGNPASQFRAALGRNYLTRSLATAASITILFAAFSVVDSGGKYLAQIFITSEGDPGSIYRILLSTAAMFGLVPILRAIANQIASTVTQAKPSLLQRVLRYPFVSTALVLIFLVILPLTLVSCVGHVVFDLGSQWTLGCSVWIVAVVISLILGTPSLTSFVNNSGYLPIYAARLARVFLGAVNPQRHRHQQGQNVSRVIEDDDVSFDEYEPYKNGGPLHLVNVAVNETIDVASERNHRDRQAENFSIGPAGVNLAKTYHALWTDTPNQLVPVGGLNQPHPLLHNDRNPIDVEGLYLREWMAISGAAFSPGMGKETRLARSLLFTAANLRLGYWWNSNLSSKDRYKVPDRHSLFESIRRWFFKLFSSQGLLLSEAFAKFGGPWLKRWYLTDGGHFEYTGAYELIRRRCPFIIILDVGADANYNGEVLALLARLTRIDFGAEFEAQSEIDARRLGVPPTVARQLANLDELLPGIEDDLEKHVSLFKVTYPHSGKCENAWHGRDQSWVLYVRAAVTGSDVPADIRHYKHQHPAFPNETTLDQFFDEQQWESYRKLGEHIGNKLFI